MSDSTISRRGFFGGAGTTAGALAALGSAGLLGATAGTAQAAVGRTYAGIGLALEIDGAFAGMLTGASGGGPYLELAEARVGAAQAPRRAVGSTRQKPVTISFTAGMSAAALEWIVGPAAPRGVTIVMFELATQADLYRLNMISTVVTAFSLPNLDGGGSDSLEFTATLDCLESTQQLTGRKGKLSVPLPKQKAIRVNGFRLFIEGLEQSTQRTRTLNGVGLKRRLATTSSGARIAPEAALTEFQDLEAIIALEGAAAMYQWFGDALVGRKAQRAGQLQLLAVDGQQVATVDFIGLVPLAVSPPYDGGSETVPMVRLELFVEEIRFNFKAMAA